MAGLYRSPAAHERIRAWCTERLEAWPVAHTRTTVGTSLGETAVVSAGTGGSALCVYLPGTNFNAATSTALLGALAQRCRVVAVDLPGQPGLSSERRPRDEVGAYAQWVAELLRSCRTEHPQARIVLAAHSRGAAVALTAPPEELAGLALLSPAGILAVRPSLAMLRATIPWLLRPGEGTAGVLAGYMSGPGHRPSAELVEWLDLVARCTRTTGAPGALPPETLARWHARPVRVAVGENDVFFPARRLAATARAALGAQPTVVRGAGHLLVDEEPEIAADLVTAMFGRS
jgi:pimeloyl-ACP methyl ester carboxylesterase